MDLKFKVGAALDASFDVTFRTAVTSARKARERINAEMKQGADFQGPYRTSAKVAGAALEDVGEKGQKAGKVLGSVADGAKQRFEELSRSLKKIPPDLALVASEAEKELRRISRAQAREAIGLGGGRGGGGQFGNRVGYWSMRNFSPVTPTLAMGANIARDIARGAGIDTSLGSQVGKSVERGTLANALTIQGHKSWAAAGSAEAGYVDPNTLSSEAKNVANQTFMDPNEILKAQTRFVDLTGDLDTSRRIMLDLGRVANATGSDMGDMAAAAAAISVNLDASMGGDKQGKIEAMGHILRNLGAQGKEGAVEIKQYAAQMSKVAAAAGAFAGTDRTEVFNLVGMMVQESRKRGGSTTATQAATSVAAFARDMTKDSKRLATQEGINVFSDKEHRFLASPEKIIEAAILKTGGSEDKLRKIFPNSMSFRAVQGFAQTYNLAEQSKPGSGKDALEAEFKGLKDAVLKEQDIAEANAMIAQTTKAQAQLFNNALGDITDKLMVQALPALNQAGPGLLMAAGKIGEFVAWAASNPWQAAGTALAVSIGKAGIEQTIRAGVEGAFKNAGAARNLFAGAAIAFTVYEVGKMAIDTVFEESRKEAGEEFKNDQEARAVLADLQHNGPGTPLTPEQLERAHKAERYVLSSNKKDEESILSPGVGTRLMDFIANSNLIVQPEDTQNIRENETAKHMQNMNGTLQEIRNLLAAQRSVHPPTIDRGSRRANFVEQ